MEGSGSSLPEREGRAWWRPWTVVALLAATLLVALPAVTAADHERAGQRFPSAQEACDYIATQARGKAFLCPASLPARVVSERSRFLVDEAEDRAYGVHWRPDKGRPRLTVLRLSRRFLKPLRRFAAQEGRVRVIEVRGGRRAIRFCLDEFCGIGWRERRSTYLALGSRRDGSRRRLRRDLRAVTRGFEVVQPNPAPPPPPPDFDVGEWFFDGSTDACTFIAGKARRPPVLCPPTLPPRLAPRGPLTLFGFFERPERWYLEWIPRRTSGLLIVARDRKRGLREARSSMRRDGRRVRDVRVRGRPGILSCARWRPRRDRFEGSCYLVWRELGGTYSVVRFAEIGLRRLRRDVRAAARSLEPVGVPAGSQAAPSVLRRVFQE
ncbi:MAG TPA: hypothetical protein VK919_11565 [Solirubrobacterales bacterium]|nr:hypothetical protein [Solirubrobacterales bacterium]